MQLATIFWLVRETRTPTSVPSKMLTLPFLGETPQLVSHMFSIYAPLVHTNITRDALPESNQTKKNNNEATRAPLDQ